MCRHARKTQGGQLVNRAVECCFGCDNQPVLMRYGTFVPRVRTSVNGTFSDSLSTYSASFSRFAEMGLVRVGDVYGLMPSRDASTFSRSIWKGSLTRIASVIPRSCIMSATARIDSTDVRPCVSMRIAVSGTPWRNAYACDASPSLVVSRGPRPPGTMRAAAAPGG